ncbi:hypothetical protein K458DRAFT_413999 [Lentithecium fluviatile CBS 122367]|uniref:Uncharacterized protein n=1 Tax=Lentithecium fluviatile CBS 122367 TaxID=1168545 RepID=A0A6G1JHP8_9PLEO|nr:hypothetical protein K458DRAFT_413999 [Lentithecium fluviatile CBS 122367]
MWQLELLSRVIPAFGALAKEFTESEHEDVRLRRDAHECYADIVTIGLALRMSCGEWASGFSDEDVNKLLAALETRIPTKRSFPIIFSTALAQKPVVAERDQRMQFHQLNALASAIESIGWDGFDECADILCQPRETRLRYLGLIGHGVNLFHKSERRDPDKRDKFLKRVRRAAKHLLEVYCKDHGDLGAGEFSLSQHPSHGMKGFADRVYHVLERHWRCNCAQRAARPGRAREARLSLTRHRQLAPKTPAHLSPMRGHIPAKFEVLLPVCKEEVEWKVTNVEVKSGVSQKVATNSRMPVDGDVCRYLKESDETLQVDFLVENETFWHLKPKLLEGINHYASMEPLRQLLGDGIAVSHISNCRPRDQLLLCYILASSILYLYPSSWFQTEWSSSMVYFIRGTNRSTSPILTLPYVSVELKQTQSTPKDPPHHMQYHSHPAILALGIIFLEIITGTRFKRTLEKTSWQQCNRDNHQAVQLLNELEAQDRRNSTKRLSSALSKAIRACLKLEPPPNFPSNQLADEGPIRHYILSCIVGPLAHELQTGYKVRLEDLHNLLSPEKAMQDPADIGDLKGISRRSTAVDKAADVDGNNLPTHTHVRFTTDTEQAFASCREACSYRNREEPIDEKKMNAATAWFKWHTDACVRIAKLRNPTICNAQRVKVAILDSGIQLSQMNKDIYNFEPSIQYRSWVGQDTEWRDSVGHGTHLATLIRKIAPDAIVHVGRVFEKRPSKNSIDSIAQAIRYAVDEWQVDIIVMSFGFGEEHEQLYKAIQYAASKDVLMFAAASNDGKNRPGGIAWPASDPNVICVHSGDGDGTASTFTPDPQDSRRIMVLGECVKSAWTERLPPAGGHKLMSGTSCAAPIAAGVAALVLDYSRGFLSPAEWNRLRRIGSMRRVFESMTDRPGGGYWWIKHWKWFDSKSSEGWIEGEIRRII